MQVVNFDIPIHLIHIGKQTRNIFIVEHFIISKTVVARFNELARDYYLPICAIDAARVMCLHYPKFARSIGWSLGEAF